MNRDQYFFCYSKNLYEFLRNENGMNYICRAFHWNTGKAFWLFERTEELRMALAQYDERER